ncbi:HlyD family type I secretion periplasmic adaptor subunit [Desulfovibrio sp. OttesenSCG-928-A18]|nr:HlyD family type I secretion periplasmic adaptor subunit [Desulfovibrio sp. OttesenSCG-928-A18]
MAKQLSQYNDALELEFMSEVDAALRNKGGKWAYRLSFILIGLFVGFIVWSCNAERNEVTRGTGQITPSLGVQPVQSEQGGIVKQIFVKEGQEVKKGDLLVQMSNIEAVADYESLISRQVESRLALQRLSAELSGDPLLYSDDDKEKYPDMVNDQIRLYETRKEKFESGNREIAANIEQKRLAVQEALTRKSQHEKNLLLLREQMRRIKPLVDRGVHPKIEYLNLHQRVVGLEGELETLAETIFRTQSEVREEESRLANRDSEWQAAVTAENNEYRRQMNTINERIKAGGYVVDSSHLTAPMNGVIRRILLKEESVAQRAETIMELLPTEDSLEVDARFQPQYRGYLEEGMPALVKIEAYDFTSFGALDAEVVRISPDTIEDNRGQAWFEVRLKTVSAKLVHDNEELEIKPGMTVTVDVISGKKSVLGYIMKPFIKTQVEASVRGTIAPTGPDGEVRPVIPVEHPMDSPDSPARELPAGPGA